MNALLNEVRKLGKTEAKGKIDSKLKEFNSYKDKSNEEWFRELCFCILTANSKARTALNIQEELGTKGFIHENEKSIRECIRRNKHRFHNNKARFIVEARKHLKIKDILHNLVKEKGEEGAREWLVDNVKGLGYKEASHFMRNVGYFNFAILDRHILNLMKDHGVIKEKPKPVSRKKYFEIEGKFKDLAERIRMKPAELDFYMWCMKTGEVLK